jgi:nucleoid-associated protein YgaU
MKKDFKIGMIIGAVALLGGVLWLSTRNNISTQARIEKSNQNRLLAQQNTPAPTYLAPEPNTTEKTPDPIPAQSPPVQPVVDATALRPPAPEETTEAEEPQEKIKTNKLHVVLEGETLSSISKRYYNSIAQWPKIMNANPDLIQDPGRIKPGMKLIIPQ